MASKTVAIVLIFCISLGLCHTILSSAPNITGGEVEIEELQHSDAGPQGLLYLVNRNHKLPASYKPSGLVEYGGVLLHAAARDAFVDMLQAMSKAGIGNVKLQSAYRNYSYQQAIYNTKVRELETRGYSSLEAKAKASQSVQPAGASEHQLGLALDVSIDGKLTQAFGNTTAGEWLAAHCHEYGFIIRYPSEKTDITQIVYEPWHLRYVGAPHASVITELGLTLEEYIGYIMHVRMYIHWERDGGYYLVSYLTSPKESLPQGATDATILPTGGQVVTVWRQQAKT